MDSLPWLFTGGSLLYMGGMFLNDAFDVEFDRHYRQERPIPSGAIHARTVWAFGLAWLASGITLLFLLNATSGCLGLVLAGFIVVYNTIHKRVSFGPVLMGICRLLLYLIAASACGKGVNGWSVWCGIALACYIVGLSYLARREGAGGVLQYWPLVFLAAPLILAFIMNADEFRGEAMLLAAIPLVWMIKSLRYTLWSTPPQIGRTVSGLLAGIVFVDWLAVLGIPRNAGFIFIGLFLLALLLQRFVPAT